MTVACRKKTRSLSVLKTVIQGALTHRFTILCKRCAEKVQGFVNSYTEQQKAVPVQVLLEKKIQRIG